MSDADSSTTNGSPARRAPGEGRDLLLTAATELFSERGYHGASTREIAERAGIAETLLFRNFGSKAALFTEVITSLLSNVQERWIDDSAGDGDAEAPAEQFRTFVDGSYTMLRGLRGIVLSTYGAAMFEPDTLSGTGDLLKGGLGRVSEAVAAQMARIGLAPSVLADETVLAMITGMALFQDWLLPQSEQPPTHEEVVDELSELILHGIRRREPG